MKKSFVLLILLLSVFVGMQGGNCGVAPADNSAPLVQTVSGKVKGIDQEGSMAFLGIPYAKIERFMPPAPVDSWDTIRVCDHWGPQAM